MKYALNVLDGQYDNNDIFTGLVDAMTMKTDREKRGVGMQNFPYPPAFDEFMHCMRITDGATYRMLCNYFVGRSERSYRYGLLYSFRKALTELNSVRRRPTNLVPQWEYLTVLLN